MKTLKIIGKIALIAWIAWSTIVTALAYIGAWSKGFKTLTGYVIDNLRDEDAVTNEEESE